ncbi:MAG TPA: hypothetical protein VKD72_10835 [Gemmataceae bacterium]|nr:hypothetical protein [Gemmataceae bacterium]
MSRSSLRRGIYQEAGGRLLRRQYEEHAMAIDFGRNITIDGAEAHLDPDTLMVAHSRSANLAAQQLYQETVVQELLQLQMYLTPQAVLRAIARAQRRVRIMPLLRPVHNAFTGPRNHAAATSRGAPLRDGSGNLLRGHRHGVGGGSDAIIEYSPLRFDSDQTPCWSDAAARAWREINLTPAPPTAGQDTGEALLHELVHALNELAGVETRAPMGQSFETVEEYYSVMVVNMYASERRRNFRASHGFEEIANPWALSVSPQQRLAIERFRNRHPALARDLEGLQVPYNPFRPGVHSPAALGRALGAPPGS